MKKRTKVLFTVFAILSTTIVSAKKDLEPVIQGVTYAKQGAIVHYDKRRNSIKANIVHYDKSQNTTQDEIVHYGSKSSNLKK